jgi:hypothetical protein
VVFASILLCQLFVKMAFVKTFVKRWTGLRFSKCGSLSNLNVSGVSAAVKEREGDSGLRHPIAACANRIARRESGGSKASLTASA